ncbi:MAG: VOC family protein [Salaquimonas sp.]
MRLNHVALTVSNRETSAEFYGRWFGLTERIHEDDHLLILSNSTGDLLAMSEGKVPPQPPRTTHFGFQIDRVKDIQALRAAFADAGVTEAEWQEHGPTRIQVFDPDGYRVEVYAF